MQVVDLLDQAPDKFLSALYLNLERLKQKEDELASKIQEKLRLIVSLCFDNSFVYVGCYCIYDDCFPIYKSYVINVCLHIRLPVVMVQLDGFLELFAT